MAKLTESQYRVLNAIDANTVNQRETVRKDMRASWDELLAANLIEPFTVYRLTPSGRLALQVK